MVQASLGALAPDQASETERGGEPLVDLAASAILKACRGEMTKEELSRSRHLFSSGGDDFYSTLLNVLFALSRGDDRAAWAAIDRAILRSLSQGDSVEGVADALNPVLTVAKFVRSKTLETARAPEEILRLLNQADSVLFDESLSLARRIKALELKNSIIPLYRGLDDSHLAIDHFRAVLGDPTLARRLKVLCSLLPTVRAASSRPRYPYITEMFRELGGAVDAFLGKRAPSNSFGWLHRLTRTRRSASEWPLADLLWLGKLFKFLGRFDELIYYSHRAMADAATDADRITIARMLLRSRSRAAALTGAEMLESLAKESRAVPLPVLIEAKLRAGKSRDIPALLKSPQPLYGMMPAQAAMVGRIAFSSEVVTRMLEIRLSAAARSLSSPSGARFLNELNDCRMALEEHSFISESTRQLSRVDQPRNPKGLIALLTPKVTELSTMPILALSELQSRGFAVTSLYPGMLNLPPTGVAVLDEISGSLGSDLDSTIWHNQADKLSNNWEIDLPSGLAVCKGVNFYGGVKESVSIGLRRYTLDFNDHKTNVEAHNCIRKMDTMVSLADRLSEVAAESDVHILIMLNATHREHGFALRKYVVDSDLTRLSIYQSCNAYENYFTNFGTPHSSTLAVRNMTKYRDLSRCFMPPAAEFARWYEQEWPALSPTTDVEAVLKLSRVRREHGGQAEAREMRSWLHKQRDGGRSVICLFGKVLFDQAVPDESGFAHTDMRHWFEHTIESVRGNDRVLLLIKPHPHELRSEIALNPSETIKDWMPAETLENVIFLPHDMFNLYETAEFTDLGVVWNGSASLELALMQIPCVVCGRYGEIDFPLGHTTPESLTHYTWMLNHPWEVEARSGILDRARALLRYLSTSHVSTPYRYTRRTLTNRRVPKSEWFAEDLARYESQGDPNVTLLADRIEADIRNEQARGGKTH